MTTETTEKTEKVRFLAAIQDPSWPEYDPAADNTEAMALGALAVGLSGWLACAPCGDPSPLQGGVVTTADGRKFAYGLCQSCAAASADEVHRVHRETRVRGRQVPLPLSEPTPSRGRVAKRVDEELDRFLAEAPAPPEVTP
jgi:hypothetical protein